MKTPATRIGSSYLLFSVFYFFSAWVLSQNNPYTKNHAAGQLFYQLHDLFFWAKAYIYFMVSVIFSAAVGALVSYRNSNTHAFRVFRNLFIISLVAFSLLIIISNGP